jgi:hypothetical protein
METINVSSLIYKEKEITESGTVEQVFTTEEAIQIVNAIKAFKTKFLRLFESRPELDCLKLVPKNNKYLELTFFKEQIIYDQLSETEEDNRLVIDFETNTVRSTYTALKNVHDLKKIFRKINELVKGISTKEVDIFEGKA